MAIITADDIEPLALQSFDDDTYNLVGTLIDMIQGEIEGYLRRPVTPTDVTDEEHVVDYMASSVFLKKTPVTQITAITADGKTLDAIGYTKQPWGLDLIGYGVWFPGQIGLPGFPGPTYDPVLVGPMFAYGSPGASGVAGWPYPGRVFKVSYTGGLDGANLQAIRSVLIRNVLRLWTWIKNGDVVRGKFSSIQVEDFTLQMQTRGNINAGARGFLDEADIYLLNDYRRKDIG